MTLNDKEMRLFEIDDDVTLAQLASAGCTVKLCKSETLRAGLLKPYEGDPLEELWRRPNLKKILRESEKLNLPTPRLQLTWVDEYGDWSHRSCFYSIVIPLTQNDIRAESESGRLGAHKEHHALISSTSVSGGNRKPVHDGRVETPFRDGAHAGWDSEAMGNMPVFAVCGSEFTKIERPTKPN